MPGYMTGERHVPEHKMKMEKGVTVTMRDGVKLSLCVYRPDGPGPFPTLFAASPYQYEMDEVPAYPLFLWRETGPVEWYTEQGYAYVHATCAARASPGASSASWGSTSSRTTSS